MVITCILLTMALAVPAFAANPKKEIKDYVEFQATNPKQDGEIQPQAMPLPILAYGRTHMSLISNHVSAYSETGILQPVNLQTECYLKAFMGGRWALIDYSVDSAIGSIISVATCAGTTYNSSYQYAADGYHRTYDPSTGYVGEGWTKDTAF